MCIRDRGDTLRANRNKLSKQIGMLMGQAKKDPSKAAEAEEIKKQVTVQADRLKELETKEAELQDKIRDIMYTIPQMIDPSVPIGPDDSCNVEVQRFGDPVVPDYPIPYHVDIMESFDGIDPVSYTHLLFLGGLRRLGHFAAQRFGLAHAHVLGNDLVRRGGHLLR